MVKACSESQARVEALHQRFYFFTLLQIFFFSTLLLFHRASTSGISQLRCLCFWPKWSSSTSARQNGSKIDSNSSDNAAERSRNLQNFFSIQKPFCQAIRTENPNEQSSIFVFLPKKAPLMNFIADKKNTFLLILYFTLAAREQNLSKMPPHVCFVGQLKDLFIQVVKWSKNWSIFFVWQLLWVWVWGADRLKQKPAKFVRDEQREPSSRISCCVTQ